MKRNKTWLFVLAVAVLVLTGCGRAATPPGIPDVDDLSTRTAQTVAAELTRIASLATPTVPPPTPQPPTPEPSPTVALPATQEPTGTEEPVPPTQAPDLPTATPIPTVTPLAGGPVATPTSSVPVTACDRAQFVADMTVIPGSSFTPGSTFTKTWRVRNAGACTWTRDYDLVFTSGDNLGSPTAIALDRDVRPGGIVELSVDLKAPSRTGDYQAAWMLSNPSGDRFGVGANGNQPLITRIKVSDLSRVVYDFVEDYCSAAWRNDDVGLPCPGVEGDAEGYVVREDNPTLENGRTENEPALVVQPRAIRDGLIRGRYPSFRVREGDHFRAIIGCMEGQTDCQVRFQLRYRVSGADAVTIQEWNERYNGKVTPVDVDLTFLAGQDVSFVLMVRARGNPDGDRAFWLAPRIVR